MEEMERERFDAHNAINRGISKLRGLCSFFCVENPDGEVSLQGDALGGVYFILNDCLDEIEEAVKKL